MQKKKQGVKKGVLAMGSPKIFFLQLTTLEGKIFLNWCSSIEFVLGRIISTRNLPKNALRSCTNKQHWMKFA